MSFEDLVNKYGDNQEEKGLFMKGLKAAKEEIGEDSYKKIENLFLEMQEVMGDVICFTMDDYFEITKDRPNKEYVSRVSFFGKELIKKCETMEKSLAIIILD